MSLTENIEEQAEEEAKAYLMYSSLAEEAEDKGLSDIAGKLWQIANDEWRHSEMLKRMNIQIHTQMHKRMHPQTDTSQPAQGYYWGVTNMANGNIMEYDTVYTSVNDAVRAAKDIYADTYPYTEGQRLVINIYDKPPSERTVGTHTPVHTELYQIGGAAGNALETLDRISEPLTIKSDRPFPETYNDWVSLAMDIKEKMDPVAWTVVNGLLQVVEEGGPEAEEAKRWLVKKAKELGIM